VTVQTDEKLLLPLRVPELGPHLSRVITGSGKIPRALDVDAVRLKLATRVFEGAGEARRLAMRGERHAAVSAVDRTMWLEAWDEAVGSIATLLADQVAERLELDARAGRLPRRKRKRLAPDAAERRAIAMRLGSAGAVLVQALDRLESVAARVPTATALERDAVQAWQDGLRALARRLEAAWLNLESAIDTELERWESVANDVAAWRPPVWPVAVGGLTLLAVALWLGLILGGQIAPPAWFAELWQAVLGR